MQQVGTRPTGRRQYHFGLYRLDPVERRLWRDGEAIAVTSKVFDVLAVLVANSGRPMDKDEIMRQVWPDSFVEEGNLTRNVSTLRKVLGDSPEDRQYIVTLPGRGYQFVQAVQEVLEGPFGMSNPTVGTDPVEKAKSNVIDEPVLAKPGARAWYLAAVFLLVAVGVWAWLTLGPGQKRTVSSPSDTRTLAVLPFLWLSPAPGDEYLGVGMADTLITRLSNLRQVIVRPTGSVLKYQSAERDLQETGRQLRVQFVLEGSLHRMDERLRVSVRLINVHDGSSLWADKFDEAWTDLLKVEDSIAERTVTALALKLTGEEKRMLEGRGTNSVEAYQLYTKARYLWNKRMGTDLQLAIGYFEQAIAKDPNYALAYVGLADTYVQRGVFGGLPPKEAYPKAKVAVARALQLDDRAGEAHVTLGHIKVQYDWDRPGAEKEYRRAIELNPNYAFAHLLYAIFLGSSKREQEAMAEIERALELDPVSPLLNTMKGAIHYWFHHDRPAIEQLLRAIELEPHFWYSHFWLALVYAHQRRNEEALVEAHKAADLSGGTHSWLLGYVQGVCGERAQALQALDELLALSRRRYVSPYDIAKVHLGLGRKEEALDWLERAYRERARWMDSLSTFPTFDPLRGDPRFQDLLRRLGLPP
jgi:TolB-like protein/DNA-binding winged helix-turn-helix (wHTH) protein/Flp pilus assembly protein TadD